MREREWIRERKWEWWKEKERRKCAGGRERHRERSRESELGRGRDLKREKDRRAKKESWVLETSLYSEYFNCCVCEIILPNFLAFLSRLISQTLSISNLSFKELWELLLLPCSICLLLNPGSNNQKIFSQSLISLYVPCTGRRLAAINCCYFGWISAERVALRSIRKRFEIRTRLNRNVTGQKLISVRG